MRPALLQKHCYKNVDMILLNNNRSFPSNYLLLRYYSVILNLYIKVSLINPYLAPYVWSFFIAWVSTKKVITFCVLSNLK